MEFRKAEAEAIIQQKLFLCPADRLENGQLVEGYKTYLLWDCERQQKYFDDMTAQGLNYKILVGDIKTEIEKLKAQIQWYEDDYKRRYPPQGHTTEEVIHLNITTGERTPEERSTIPNPTEWHYIRFKNTVIAAFLELIKKDIVRHIIRANIPSREERLALEARAARIIQEAHEKAEADLQKLVSEILPRQLAKYAKAEHAEFIREKLQELRQWLKDNWQPWFDFEAFSPEELVNHFLASDVIRKEAEDFLKNSLAERITTVRYAEHLAALADELEPQKKQYRPLIELGEFISRVLIKKGVLNNSGGFIGGSTQVKALYKVLITGSYIPPKSYKEFAPFFSDRFNFPISDRTLREKKLNIGQEQEEAEFKAILSMLA